MQKCLYFDSHKVMWIRDPLEFREFSHVNKGPPPNSDFQILCVNKGPPGGVLKRILPIQEKYAQRRSSDERDHRSLAQGLLMFCWCYPLIYDIDRYPLIRYPLIYLRHDWELEIVISREGIASLCVCWCGDFRPVSRHPSPISFAKKNFRKKAISFFFWK